MDPIITKILTETRTDSVFHTHVSLVKPKGKFEFNRPTLEEFWDAYCKYIYTCEDPVIGIAEKPQGYLPILVDVDLKIRYDDDKKVGNKLYTDEQLMIVVSVYQSVLRKILAECSDEELTCIVLEKEMYQKTQNNVTYLKNGFHLHFPIFLSKEAQEVQLIPRVKDLMKDSKLFDNLGIEDSGSVIDKACCTNHWLLYGSRKDVDMKPYKVTKVYDMNTVEIPLEEAFKHYHIFDMQEKLIPIAGNVEYYLPRILSIIPYGRSTKELKRGTISPLKEKARKERKSSNIQNEMNYEEAMSLSKTLLELISDFRAVDRNEWMNIGWILYNISDGSPDGLEMWQTFSARAGEDIYDSDACIYQWERMVKKNKGISSLRYYAKLDNPSDYAKLKNENAEKYVLASLEGSHNDIAKILWEQYGEEFRCASYTGKVWYQFVQHHWVEIEEGVFLRSKISDNVVERYKKAREKICMELGKEEDKSKQAMYQARLKSINKMIGNLKNANYKTSIMKEACEVFYDPKFNDKLDKDPYLIAFKNGVYDLRLNIFRPGTPEDYLSRAMPINYRIFSEDDPKVIEVHNFLEKIFPDSHVRKYFMDISSDVFVGGNHEKIVLFWTGEGDNGKSVTQTFFEKMLGNLAVKLNTNVITGKKPSAGSAFADLARTGNGVRWVVLEEPDNDEMINVGIFKHLSGNDKFFARDLFEKGKQAKEIEPLFKLIFICNKLPKIKYADQAVWNRVRVIPFESTFCKPDSDNPAPETYEEQMQLKRFPMDKQFSKKIPDLVEAFAWILLEHRKSIGVNVKINNEPAKVRSATEMYRKQNDNYRQFLVENIIEDNKASISLGEIHTRFLAWLKEFFPGHPSPNKNEIEEYFSKIWGAPKMKGTEKRWKKYRFRGKNEQNDGDDEDDQKSSSGGSGGSGRHREPENNNEPKKRSTSTSTKRSPVKDKSTKSVSRTVSEDQEMEDAGVVGDAAVDAVIEESSDNEEECDNPLLS